MGRLQDYKIRKLKYIEANLPIFQIQVIVKENYKDYLNRIVNISLSLPVASS